LNRDHGPFSVDSSPCCRHGCVSHLKRPTLPMFNHNRYRDQTCHTASLQRSNSVFNRVLFCFANYARPWRFAVVRLLARDVSCRRCVSFLKRPTWCSTTIVSVTSRALPCRYKGVTQLLIVLCTMAFLRRYLPVILFRMTSSFETVDMVFKHDLSQTL
jgi:hypothetical protein